MTTVAATLVCVALGALAVFQVLLVRGAPLGHLAWGGQHRVLPRSLRIGSAVAIPIYVVIAVIVLARADLILLGAIPGGVIRVAMWVVVAYLALGTVMNLASRSKPERYVMSPVAGALCALCVVVAVS